MVDFSALPAEAERYFEAARGLVQWEEVFTPQAVVRDVERDIRGRAAIAAWARDEVDGGKYQLLAYQPKEGGVWMLVEFHPASWHPFLAEYEFEFQDHQVSRAVLSYSPEVEPRWRSIPLPVRRAFESGALGEQAAPSRVVPRIGGLRIEWPGPSGARVRNFTVRAERWEEVR